MHISAYAALGVIKSFRPNDACHMASLTLVNIGTGIVSSPIRRQAIT